MTKKKNNERKVKVNQKRICDTKAEDILQEPLYVRNYRICQSYQKNENRMLRQKHALI